MATVRKSSSNRDTGDLGGASKDVLRRSKLAGSELMHRATRIKEKIDARIEEIHDSKLRASAKR